MRSLLGEIFGGFVVFLALLGLGVLLGSGRTDAGLTAFFTVLIGLCVRRLALLAYDVRRLWRMTRAHTTARPFRPARRRRMRSAQPWPLRWRSQSHRFDDWLCELAMIEQFDPQRHEVRGMLRRAGERRRVAAILRIIWRPPGRRRGGGAAAPRQ